MLKDKIFFGESGLTSTSANFIANQAKEAYLSLESKLNRLRFYTEKVTTLNSNEEKILKRGTSNVEFIEPYIERIAKLKSLIAWLREAIKAKERLIQEVKCSTYEDYSIEEPLPPKAEESISEDAYISTWNIKKRNRYYFIETLCSTYGQYIHQNGSIANARKKLAEVIEEPSEMSDNTTQAVLRYFEPTISPEEVDLKYMQLQQAYREYQAELNSYKHEVQMAVEKDTVEKYAKYSKEYNEYTAKRKAAEVALEAAKQQALQTIQAFKIVIPDDLKPLYEEVSRMGK